MNLEVCISENTTELFQVGWVNQLLSNTTNPIQQKITQKRRNAELTEARL